MKALAPSKYFQSPQHAYNATMVNRDVVAAIGVDFHVIGSYDNALGKSLIEAKLGKKIFSLISHLDPEIARYQLDKNLP